MQRLTAALCMAGLLAVPALAAADTEGDVEGYQGDARVLMQRITDGMSRSASDADGDGRVQRAEFIDGTQAWLNDLDRNGDGVITADDLAL